VKQSCENARTLIPSYLDGELSEDQAGPLRQHLLACPACREIAKRDTNLKRWFVPGDAVPVPAGFSARVIRAAFLGAESLGAAGAKAMASGEGPDSGSSETRLRSFVLALTAAAAVILIVVSAALRTHGLPTGQDMSAEPAQRPLSELLRELDRKNHRAIEQGPVEAGVEGGRAELTPPGER
jgi:anti-sigma factor RsiW